MARATWLLLLPCKEYVLTITTDNGSEFMEYEWLADRIGATVYFADHFRNVEQADIGEVQRKINRRPREKLNFDSPKNVFFKAMR